MTVATRRSTDLGSYSPNRFMITLGPKFHMVNASDLSPKDLDDDQLSILFHEYIHYLQNISTVAGYHGFRRYLDLWRLFAETVGEDGTSAGSDALSKTHQQWVFQYLAIAYEFDGEWEPDWPDGFDPNSFEIEDFEVIPHELPIGDQTALVSAVTLYGRAVQDSMTVEEFAFQIGEVSISEGIAYELDQIVAAGEQGGKTPKYPSPPFPYEILRKFCELRCPGIDTLSVIRLGCLSLLSNDPAGALADLCMLYAQGIQSSSPESVIDRIHGNSTQIRELITDAILKTDIPQHDEEFQGHGSLSRAVKFIHGLFRRSLQRRLVDPFIELNALSRDSRVDRQRLNDLLVSIPPCTVRQEGRGSKHRISRDSLLNFGPLESADADLSVLHCAQHFLLAHLGPDRLLPSKKARSSPCPFYSCCSLAMRREASSNCKSRPWRAATGRAGPTVRPVGTALPLAPTRTKES